MCSALLSKTVEFRLGLPPSLLCYFGRIDCLSVSQTGQPCSHLRALVCAVPSARNALPTFQRTFSIGSYLLLSSHNHAGFFPSICDSGQPASELFPSLWSVSPWECKFHEGRGNLCILSPVSWPLAQHPVSSTLLTYIQGRTIQFVNSWQWCC